MKMLREQEGSQEGLEIDIIISLILAVDFLTIFILEGKHLSDTLPLNSFYVHQLFWKSGRLRKCQYNVL